LKYNPQVLLARQGFRAPVAAGVRSRVKHNGTTPFWNIIHSQQNTITQKTVTCAYDTSMPSNYLYIFGLFKEII
jgi:hypothetical protein